MWKSIVASALAALCATAGLAAELTPLEQRWLKGAWPVVAFARQAGLPLDVIVQPQATPGASPMALAFVDGRCKLVLSMRENPEAKKALDRVEPELMDATLELMAAHELGHCRRYLDGAWFGVPAGFVASVPDIASPVLRAAYVNMQAVRREEGYGDLVGLAWTQQRHPQHYARLHAWLVRERSRDLIPGSHHDTLAWIRLAPTGEAVGAASLDASLFKRAFALWTVGLAAED